MTTFRIPKSAFPNSVTSLSLFCGFLSIVNSDNGNLKFAAILIVLAGIFDTLDGLAARLVKVASKFGVELDSLADIVSFGAAPSFLIYKAYFYQFGPWGIIASSLPVIFGAFRLARFNVNVEDLTIKKDFTGLPIPLQAAANCFFIISYYRDGKIIEPFSYFFLPLVVLLAYLMVSNIRYNALPKFKDKKLAERIFLISFFSIALVLVILTDGIVLFYFTILLVFFGIFRHIFYKFFPISE